MRRHPRPDQGGFAEPQLFSRDMLVAEQMGDPTLVSLREVVVPLEESGNTAEGHFLQGEVLMRK